MATKKWIETRDAPDYYEGVRRRLLNYVAADEQIRFSRNEDINHFLSENNFGWFLGVLFDKLQIAERAWEFPFYLYQKLGQEKFNPNGIAAYTLANLDGLFVNAPKKLRQPLVSSASALRAAYKIKTEYAGETGKIWAELSGPKELQNRFEEFYDIGQKKASMAVNMLIRMSKVTFRSESLGETEISNDKHVRQVLSRLGFREVREKHIGKINTALVEIGKLLNRENPGLLDLPLWQIGRYYCSSSTPQCSECCLNDICKKDEISKE